MKSMDTKRKEAAARQLEAAAHYRILAARSFAAGWPDRVAYHTGRAERAERDAANALAKVRSRPAAFVPWYDRSDPTVPGQQ